MDSSLLICPACGQALTQNGNVLRCASGHSYDIAKEGYVNLLPANAKKSLLPGDNKLMVNARKEFLSRGYFEPLARELTATVGRPEAVLDAGCGTGYYGAYLKKCLSESGAAPYVCGIDISKFAVAKAAKSGIDSAAVGSVFHLPVKDRSFGCVVSVFAPVSAEEFYRVTKDGATVVTVCPAEKHLLELKTAMYGSATYENPPENAQKPLLSQSGEELFTHVKTVRKTYTETVVGTEDITALLYMTPYAYKTAEEKKSKLLSLPSISCTFDFYLTVYKKI